MRLLGEINGNLAAASGVHRAFPPPAFFRRATVRINEAAIATPYTPPIKIGLHKNDVRRISLSSSSGKKLEYAAIAPSAPNKARFIGAKSFA